MLSDKLLLYQNYANTFSSWVAISFSLAETQLAKISVFNTIGERLAKLANQEYDAGVYRVYSIGNELSSGIHWYKLENLTKVDVKKKFTKIIKVS